MEGLIRFWERLKGSWIDMERLIRWWRGLGKVMRVWERLENVENYEFIYFIETAKAGSLSFCFLFVYCIFFILSLFLCLFGTFKCHCNLGVLFLEKSLLLKGCDSNKFDQYLSTWRQKWWHHHDIIGSLEKSGIQVNSGEDYYMIFDEIEYSRILLRLTYI